MREIFPKYLERFLSIIIEFYDKALLVRTSNLITIKELSELHLLANEILDEYWAIIQAYSIDDKKLKENQKDVWGILEGIFYTEKGQKIDWTKGLGLEKMDVKAMQLISTLESFLSSRVYLTLLEVYEKLLKRENFLGTFVKFSQNRGGRYRPPELKGDLEGFMVGDNKKDEKK